MKNYGFYTSVFIWDYIDELQVSLWIMSLESLLSRRWFHPAKLINVRALGEASLCGDY